MALSYCTNTFQSLIFIISIGNIHKCMCRIIILPRYIWAYNAGTIISDVVVHFEPCHRLIRPYIFLFNSLMSHRDLGMVQKPVTTSLSSIPYDKFDDKVLNFIMNEEGLVSIPFPGVSI